MKWTERGETFHREGGPAAEARLLHIEPQRLIERWAASSHSKFVVWDVGFGAAGNALAAVGALRSQLESLSSERLDGEIHSFDQTTAPVEFALKHANDLDYLNGHHEILRLLLRDHRVDIVPGLTWRLHLGDFRQLLDTPSSSHSCSALSEKIKNDLEAPDAILYDPYSPVGNAEMWTLDHFTNLFQRLEPSRPCLLTNYTRSTAVRVALLLSGFSVGVGCSVGEKAETTIASNCFSLLERPLDLKWLERVKGSGNAAPLRSPIYSQSRISPEDLERLKGCSQFS